MNIMYSSVAGVYCYSVCKRLSCLNDDEFLASKTLFSFKLAAVSFSHLHDGNLY